jgi:hypothetical protein
MGTLLTFQPSLHGSRNIAPAAETGKLLLFTGIRYERTDGADKPDERKRGRRVRSRRPT